MESFFKDVALAEQMADATAQCDSPEEYKGYEVGWLLISIQESLKN